MKHILRNSLLLFPLLMLALASCQKADTPTGGDSPAGSDIKLSYTPEGDDSIVRVQYTRDGLTITGAEVKLALTIEPLSEDSGVDPAQAAASIAEDWKSSLSATAVVPGNEQRELKLLKVSAQDDVLSVTIDPVNLGRDFIIIGASWANVTLKVSCGSILGASETIKFTPSLGEESRLIKYLLGAFDKDGDGQVEDVDKITELNLSGFGLTFIEDIIGPMSALTSLDCSNNSLTALDLSGSRALTTLNCSNNSLTSIDLSLNRELTSIDCSRNNLTEIDLSDAENLRSVNLKKNENLKKIVCKSSEWLLGFRDSNFDPSICCLKDGSPITIDDSYETVIDGKTWKQFNFGATLADLYGPNETFTEAKSACPEGWRLPTKDECTSLAANYSDWTTYLGVSGRWLSGSNPYSESVAAVFFPARKSRAYWTCSTYNYNATGTSADLNARTLNIAQDKVYTRNEEQDATIAIRCVKEDGPYPFSVSASVKVAFSPGNLRKCSSWYDVNWDFANEQYYTVEVKDNEIFPSEQGVFHFYDLFGWGTGDNAYNASEDNADYATFTDWGTNQMLNYDEYDWRTLSQEEWSYVFSKRPNAKTLRGFATVRYRAADASTDTTAVGLVLLPDNWTLPEGLPAFNSSTERVTEGNVYERNVYTDAQWARMASYGAVFLPAAGVRSTTTVDGVQKSTVQKAGENGYYWSSTPAEPDFDSPYYGIDDIDPDKAYGFSFTSKGTVSTDNVLRRAGRSVRLVKNL